MCALAHLARVQEPSAAAAAAALEKPEQRPPALAEVGISLPANAVKAPPTEAPYADEAGKARPRPPPPPTTTAAPKLRPA